MLPAVLPMLPAVLMADARLWLLAALWFALWCGFVVWRGVLHFRSVIDKVTDEPYDRIGKYKLSREYWSTESAAAARHRRKKRNV